MDDTDEIWKDIPDWEGSYQVSSIGRVRSLDRSIVGGGSVPVKNRKGAIKAQYLSGDRTKYLTVRLCKDGTCQAVKVHHAVLEAFKGPKPSENSVARHLNDNEFDNRRENVDWGSSQENAKDKFKNGYVTHLRNLSDDVVSSIRADTRSQRAIAEDFGTNQKTVWRIKNNMSYQTLSNGRY